VLPVDSYRKITPPSLSPSPPPTNSRSYAAAAAQCITSSAPYLVHGCGSISVLEVDVGVERAEVNDDLLVGLGTGKMEGRPGMEWGQGKDYF
jgi:hypothetical protein